MSQSLFSRGLSCKTPEALLAESKQNLRILITPISTSLYNEIELQVRQLGLYECLVAQKLMWYCDALEHHITTRNSYLTPCCGSLCKTPEVDINTNDYEETVERFILMRTSVALELNETKKTSYCQGCRLLKQRFSIGDSTRKHFDRIKRVNFVDQTICNMNCIYCTSPVRDAKTSKLPVPNYAALINALHKKCQIDENLLVSIACSEITATPNSDKMLSEFVGYKCVVATNAMVYQNSIFNILECKNGSHILTSMDAGTRETFLKVKGRDAWNRVCDNLKRYSNGGRNDVRLKYIVLPGINDNKEEAAAFLMLCKNIGASTILLSRDAEEAKKGAKLPHSAYETLAFLYRKAKEFEFKVDSQFLSQEDFNFIK